MRIIEYIIDKSDTGKSIREYLKRCGYSSGVITLLKKIDNGITVNGIKAFTNVILHEKDSLVIKIADQPSEIIPEKLDFSIVYEDDDLLVYDKPSGVVVHPTKIYQSGTLGNDYAYRCKIKNELCTFRPVYRIDRNTSGLVLIAKNKLAACVKVSKKYLCVCHGIVFEVGYFDGSIGLCDNSKIKREVRSDGQTAVTHYKRIEFSDNYSLCEVRLETGRTHQIRVHFSNAGYPLAGDSLYGFSNDGMTRHALHCASVEFTNPITAKNVKLYSSIPSDMQKFISNNICKMSNLPF